MSKSSNYEVLFHDYMSTLESTIKMVGMIKLWEEGGSSGEGGTPTQQNNILLVLQKVLLELNSLLKRVSEGVSRTHKVSADELRQVKKHFQNHRFQTSLAYGTLLRQYETYKQQNDLDVYFAKGLNNATRRAVLQMVAELENTDSEENQ